MASYTILVVLVNVKLFMFTSMWTGINLFFVVGSVAFYVLVVAAYTAMPTYTPYMYVFLIFLFLCTSHALAAIDVDINKAITPTHQHTEHCRLHNGVWRSRPNVPPGAWGCARVGDFFFFFFFLHLRVHVGLFSQVQHVHDHASRTRVLVDVVFGAGGHVRPRPRRHAVPPTVRTVPQAHSAGMRTVDLPGSAVVARACVCLGLSFACAYSWFSCAH